MLCKHVPTHQQSCKLVFYYNTAADLKGYLWLHLLAEIGNILKHATHEAMMRQRVEYYASRNTVMESSWRVREWVREGGSQRRESGTRINRLRGCCNCNCVGVPPLCVSQVKDCSCWRLESTSYYFSLLIGIVSLHLKPEEDSLQSPVYVSTQPQLSWTEPFVYAFSILRSTVWDTCLERSWGTTL